MNAPIVLPNGDFVKPAEMRVYDVGIQAKRSRLVTWNKTHVNPPKRGEIKAFSLAARRRLRTALLTQYVPDSTIAGLTLTMPGEKLREWKDRRAGSAVCAESCAAEQERRDVSFRVAFERFRHSFSRIAPESAIIYRVELQTKSRYAPHVHAVVFLRPSEGRSVGWLRGRISEAWTDACQECGWGEYSLFDHILFGAHWDPLEDRGAMIRYCCDHASKHKKEQLGFAGKQWGFVSRKNLVDRPFELVEDERVQNRISRAVGLLRRGRVKDSRCPFGWRHSKYHKADSGISYAGTSTLRKLLDWAKSEEG